MTVAELKEILSNYDDKAYISFNLKNQYLGGYKFLGVDDDLQINAKDSRIVNFDFNFAGTLPFGYELFGEHMQSENGNEEDLEDYETTIKELNKVAEKLSNRLEEEKEVEDDDYSLWDDDEDLIRWDNEQRF